MSSDTVRKFEPYSMSKVYQQSSKELFTVVSTFSGGGGSSTGYQLGGGKILMVNEFIDSGVDTYRSNYPNTPIEHIEIRQITRRKKKGVLEMFSRNGIQKGEYDILDGSPPCSTFSTSGKGKSKILEKNVKYSDKTLDRVGMLIHDLVYICNVTQPRIVVIENVPTMKSSEVFSDSLNRLRKWGYKVNYKVMCSSHFGVPQRRRRLIVVGIRPDVCDVVGIQSEDDILDLYPEPSSYEPTIEDGIGDLQISKKERTFLMTSLRKGSNYEKVKVLPFNPDKTTGLKDLFPQWTSDFNLSRSSWTQPVSTLTSTGLQIGRGGTFHPFENRQFSLDEVRRLTGLPDDFILKGTYNQKMERCGRMVTPPLYEHLSTRLYERVLKPFHDHHFL